MIENGMGRIEVIDLGVEQLPNNMMFSPCCDKVVIFVAFSKTSQSGRCICGKTVTEYNDKNETVRVSK